MGPFDHKAIEVLLKYLGPFGALLMGVVVVLLVFLYLLIKDHRKEVRELILDGKELSQTQTSAILQISESLYKLREDVLRGYQK